MIGYPGPRKRVHCGELTFKYFVIPKPLREELHLGAGDELLLESEGDETHASFREPGALLKKEKGVWVYQGERTQALIPDLIDRERAQRSRDLLA